VPDEPEEGWTDVPADSDEPTVAHDDIMKRLIDYQRTLREGASPEEAAEAARSAFTDPRPPEAPTTVSELVDVTAETEERADVEVQIEPEPATAEAEPEPPTAEAEPASEPLDTGWEDVVPPQAEPEWSPTAEAPGYVTIPESPAETRQEAADPVPDLRAEVGSLEERLDRLVAKIGELRSSFQDMAIAADERLAAMEREIGDLRRGGGE
jgi:hypothetical protein